MEILDLLDQILDSVFNLLCVQKRYSFQNMIWLQIFLEKCIYLSIYLFIYL